MKYVIAYDIVSNKRRRHTVRALLGYGYRVQKSVFEGFLSRHELSRLMTLLEKIIDPKTDSIRVYPACETCSGKMVCIGTGKPVEQLDYMVL